MQTLAPDDVSLLRSVSNGFVAECFGGALKPPHPSSQKRASARLTRAVERCLEHMLEEEVVEDPQGLARIVESLREGRRSGFKTAHAKAVARGMWESAVSAAPTVIDTEVSRVAVTEAAKAGFSIGGKHMAEMAGKTVEEVFETSITLGGRRLPILGGVITAALTLWRSGKLYREKGKTEAAMELGVGTLETIGATLPGGLLLAELMRQTGVEITDVVFHRRPEDSNLMHLIKLGRHYYHAHREKHAGRKHLHHMHHRAMLA